MTNPELSKSLKTIKRDALSQAIRQACSARRLNLKQAAKLSAISYPTLCRLAQRQSTPNRQTHQKLKHWLQQTCPVTQTEVQFARCLQLEAPITPLRLAALRATLGSLLDCYDQNLRAPRGLHARESRLENARKETAMDTPSVPFSPVQK